TSIPLLSSGEPGRNLCAAEEALAPAVHGPRAAAQTVNRCRWDDRVHGITDLSASDSFTEADDLAIGGILVNQFRIRVGPHLVLSKRSHLRRLGKIGALLECESCILQ